MHEHSAEERYYGTKSKGIGNLLQFLQEADKRLPDPTSAGAMDLISQHVCITHESWVASTIFVPSEYFLY